MKLKPRNLATQNDIEHGLNNLRQALSFFITADCPKTCAKIRSALKSAEGAARHAQRRPVR